MGKLIKDDVQFTLKNGIRLITDVTVIGVKDEVQEVQIANTGIWCGSDWGKLEDGQLAESESKEFDELLMQYGESLVDELSA